MCVTVDLFEECHMATALRNTGTWSQFVAWWGESHDMTAILRELGVGWYLGQIAKCRNDCQKGGVVDHQSRGGGRSWVSSIQQGSSHAFTMFPLIRKCNEVITQESSRCNWKEIGKAVLVNGCLGGGPCCCGWPVAPELLIKTWRLRSKEEDALFIHPCNALITSTDLWTRWTGQRRQNWLACTKPGFSSEQWRNGHAIWREAVAEHWRKAIVRQRFMESSHVCVRLADMMSDELSLLLQCFTLGLITWSKFYSPVSVYLTLYVAHAHLLYFNM